MSKLCPYCKSKKVGSFNDTVVCCMACHQVFGKSQLIDSTLFDRITESPEVLASKLVYSMLAEDICLGTKRRYYYSTITGQRYDKEAEAIAAALAELKKV